MSLNFLYILFFFGEIQPVDIALNEVRLNYQKAAISEQACEELIDALQAYHERNNTTLAAYKAASTMMMAKHAFNPINKLTYFNQGKDLLEKCIAIDQRNVEIHYIRFAIQSNSPAFLGYHDNISEDKLFLLQRYKTLDDLQLRRMIVSILTSSEYLTLTEKQNLQQ